ncbi:MAG: hypothetical protein ACI9G1_001480, partial [Pirellulaceae bacterium]
MTESSTSREAKPTAGKMSLSRRSIVYSVAALLIVGHMIDIVFFTEHWPFSRYPMYSRLMSKPQLTK